MGRATGQRQKVFRYRDRTGASQEAHAAHWAGFSFEGGPVCVRAIGIWGEAQCWAASESEGKRFIRHGLVFGGFDPDDPAQGSWKVRTTTGRNGQGGTYDTARDRYGWRVTKRPGPNGAPYQ